MAAAVARFAGEMEPDALEKAGDKIMSASSKFTSGLNSDNPEEMVKVLMNCRKITITVTIL